MFLHSSSSRQDDPSKKQQQLGSIHGPVLFEIFKYLHSKHLLSSIVLVCREWKSIVAECVMKLELKENNYSEWYQEQLKIFGSNPSANTSVKCPQQVIYSHVSQLLTSIANFENLQELSLIGYDALMSSDDMWKLLTTLKQLKRLLISDSHLLEGQLARRLTFKDQKSVNRQASSGNHETSEKKGLFSKLFSKNKTSDVSSTSGLLSNELEASKGPRSVKYSDRSTLTLNFERVPCKEKLSLIPTMGVENLTCLCLFKVYLPDALYYTLMEKLVNLKEFRMVDCNLTKFELYSLSKCLSHVEINRTNCNNATVTISDRKNNLLSQTLEFLVFNNVKVESEHAWKFCASCTKLKTLKMRKYFQVPAVTHNLTSFTTTTSIENLSIESVGMDSKDLEKLSKWTPNLKKLEILHCQSLTSQEQLLKIIMDSFKQLTHFRAVNVRDLASSDIISTNLEFLDLSSNKDFTGTIDCHSLKYLNISGTALSDVDKTKIVMKNSSLEELNLSMMDSSEAIGNAWTLGMLKRLDLSYNRSVHDERLSEILQFMPMLEYLNLKMCKNIHQLPLKKKCNLKILLLSGTQMNDQALVEATMWTPELQRLDVDCCGMLENPELSHLSKLSSLDVSENTSFTLTTILKLAKQIPSLRYFYVRWISNLITNHTSSKELMDAFRNLLLLDLTGSVTSTCTVLIQLMHEFKDLTIVSKTPVFRCDSVPNPFTVFGTKL